MKHTMMIAALMCAAVCGHERLVELLLWRGAEIHLQYSDGLTATRVAALHEESALGLTATVGGFD